MRSYSVLCGSVIAALLMISGQSGMAAARDADTQALTANEMQWNQDYLAKDLDKIMAHYADDVIVMAPGMPAASGKDAVRQLLKGMLDDPAMSLKFHASKVEVSKSGDIGYTQGSYAMTFTDPATKKVINDHGSYVTTYRKQADGSWRAVADIASSER
jgi:uncharacterized protein (TIGR02246 family)